MPPIKLKKASAASTSSSAGKAAVADLPYALQQYSLIGGDKETFIRTFYSTAEKRIKQGKNPFETEPAVSADIAGSSSSGGASFDDDEIARFKALEAYYKSLHEFAVSVGIFDKSAPLPDLKDVSVKEYFNRHKPSPLDQMFLGRPLGAGEYSVVYHVKREGDPFYKKALKILTSTKTGERLSSSDKFAALQEAMLLTRLLPRRDEKYIMPLDYFFMLGDHPGFLFDEAVETLDDHLRFHSFRLGFNIVSTVMKQLFIAFRHLAKMHVIYGDLHLKNVVRRYTRFDGDFAVSLIDFGLAQYDFQVLRRPEHVSPKGLQAPELLLGLPYSMPIDSWCLGLMFYTLYTGRYLFSKDPTIAEYVDVLGMPPLDFIMKLSPAIRKTLFAKVTGIKPADFYGPEIFYCKELSESAITKKILLDYEVDGVSLALSHVRPFEGKMNDRAQRLKCYRLFRLLTKYREVPAGKESEFKEFVILLAGLLTWDACFRLTPDKALSSSLFGRKKIKKSPSDSLLTEVDSKSAAPAETISRSCPSSSSAFGGVPIRAASRLTIFSTPIDLMVKEVIFPLSSHPNQQKIQQLILSELFARIRLIPDLFAAKLNEATFTAKNKIDNKTSKKVFIFGVVKSMYTDPVWDRYGYESSTAKLKLMKSFLEHEGISKLLQDHTSILGLLGSFAPSTSSTSIKDQLLEAINESLSHITTRATKLSSRLTKTTATGGSRR